MRSFDLHASGQRSWSTTLLPLSLLPVLALAIVWPLFLHGPSCGHDFGFHLGSWMDAAAQIRGGDLLPRWAFSPAFNAGEPRFVFYPPLSWLLGSLLVLLLPAAVVPAVFTWLALTGAAAGMYALARRFAEVPAAMLAAAVYIASPYVLFTAFERTAFAELLAAAWMPLLLRAALREKLRPVAIAVPLALLWLTNAPAAVMGTYALVAILLLRLLFEQGSGRRNRKIFNRIGIDSVSGIVVPGTLGLVLGLGLAGFYLVPAAFERRYVQIAMAVIPNMRVEDNFLFGGTGNGPHDAVLHTASVVAVDTICLLLLFLGISYLRRQSRDLRPGNGDVADRYILPLLAVLAGTLSLLLWRGTVGLWHALPELAFLQFPWRLLSVLGCVLGLATGLALRSVPLPVGWAAAGALALAVIASAVAIVPFRQGCEAGELPAPRLARFATHHGVEPTDEYTPGNADNDQLRWGDPAWWLGTVPDAPAPGTVPNPAATIPDYDGRPPVEETVAGFAPHRLTLHLDRPEILILNLRNYPAWAITLNGDPKPKRLERDDGLLTVALPAGKDIVDIRWRTLPDVWAGDALTAISLAGAGWLGWRSRRMGSLCSSPEGV